MGCERGDKLDSKEFGLKNWKNEGSKKWDKAFVSFIYLFPIFFQKVLEIK